MIKVIILGDNIPELGFSLEKIERFSFRDIGDFNSFYRKNKQDIDLNSESYFFILTDNLTSSVENTFVAGVNFSSKKKKAFVHEFYEKVLSKVLVKNYIFTLFLDKINQEQKKSYINLIKTSTKHHLVDNLEEIAFKIEDVVND